MEKIVKLLTKKEVVYFCIVPLITKCIRAEIKGDEKLLIDLKGPCTAAWECPCNNYNNIVMVNLY